ncbi:hypothetical protein [Phenylobacterium soli]|uniref:hypothetical protein n=1 Tax=Phenylobacterium soli TaxID=2170551 RepID=UPI0010581957|nr:hypothetical protein [Phenylobacterium soli]
MARHARFERSTPGGAVRTALRLAPWVVFGPITGFFTELALRMLQRGRPVAAALLICANIAAVASIPLLTAAIASNAQ